MTVQLAPILCVILYIGVVGAQFFATGHQQHLQQQFPRQLDRSVPQLSSDQQSQILSDVQQHQHRFGLQLRANSGIPQPQLFIQRNKKLLEQSGLFSSQVQQQLIGQQQQLPSNQQFFQQPQPTNPTQQFFSTDSSQLLSSFAPPVNNAINFANNNNNNNYIQQRPQLTPETQQNSIVFPSIPPSVATPSGSVIQHHTQTNFAPNYQQSAVTPRSQYINTRPTADPIESINDQIRQLDPEKHKQKIKELQDKKSIIEKHNQFIEKQYEKSLKKAQQEHHEFQESQREQRKKLYENLARPSGEGSFRYSRLPRFPYPEEGELFQKALKQYYLEHPTTTTTTTTTTTQKPTTTRASIKKQQKPSFLPTIVPNVKSIQSLDDLQTLRKQYKNQEINKDDLLAQLRAAIKSTNEDDSPKNLTSREVSLPNGKKVQLIEDIDPKLIPEGKEEEITLPNGDKVIAIRADPSLFSKPSKPVGKLDEITLPSGQKVQVIKTSKDTKNLDLGQEITLPDGQKAEIFKTASSSSAPSYKSQEITLPNGQKVEVIKTTDPKLVPGGVPLEPGSDLEKLVLAKTTTIKPPKAILDELTKDVVPPGADFELLKTGASGGLENINTPNQIPNQKKVTFVLLEEQSDGSLKVQGIKGNGKEKPDVDLDSILKKIKAGEIKLPSTTTSKPKTTTTTERTTYLTTTPTTTQRISVTVTPNSFATHEDNKKFQSTLTSFQSTESSSLPILSTNIGSHFLSSSSPSSSSIYTTASDIYSSIPSSTQRSIFDNKLFSVPQDQTKQASSISTHNKNSFEVEELSTSTAAVPTATPKVAEYVVKSHSHEDQKESAELTSILKSNGLYAMARFLKQSGLDTVLNDTGPYTIFAPTDKAFRALLVQLGGPERAEEKFKENPRLLSGLLLHHVIPGSFTISELQDEMTGVSLAGTQLRVNQYDMHDNEWNDIKVTTINGARILDDHQDITIPQGLAHAVDRVMFPLPVGDIVQTMQSDRERRFSTFLRAVFAGGMTEILQGPKSLTLFAPTDKAFAGLSAEDLSKTVTDPVLAKELVLRHLMHGTLYTNGMRYYQVKDSLQKDAPITISKHSGKTKINNQQLTSPNIPATNGVMHAIDVLL